MADPLGIVGVIGVAAQIIQHAVRLGQDWKDVPTEVRKFLAELQALRLALQETHEHVVNNPDFAAAFAGGRHSAVLSQLENAGTGKEGAAGDDLGGTVSEVKVLVMQCRRELEKMLEELRSRAEGHRFGWDRLQGAFRAKSTRQIVEDLHRQCQTLNWMTAIDSIALQARTNIQVTEMREIQGIYHDELMNEQKQWRDEERDAAAELRENVDHLVKQQDLAMRESTKRLPMFDDLVNTHQEEQDNAIIQWFSKIQSGEKQAHTLRSRQQGTCGYLLESSTFQSWLDGDERILWCIGAPGTGKTIMASAVIDLLETKCDYAQVARAFVYCNYAERNDQTIEQLLGSLIQQLLRQCPIPTETREVYKLHKDSKTRSDLNVLSTQLRLIVSRFSLVYIVVDALDECEDVNKTRSTLLQQLEGLAGNVQVLVTSRPLGDIGSLEKAVRFDIVAQEDDMHKYITAQIKQETQLLDLCKKDKNLERDILDQIVSKAHGMFLLAKLHFQAVASQLRLKTVRKALSTLPGNIDDTYEDTINRIQNGQQKEQSELAMRTLMILTLALEALDIGEVQHALLTMELDEDDNTIDVNDVYDQDLLVAVCGGMIVIEEETGNIRFVHHTAEKYFETHADKLFEHGRQAMADMCKAYLSLDDFASGPCVHIDDLSDRYETFPLYRYVATRMGDHVDASTLDEGVLKIFETEGYFGSWMEMIMVPRAGKFRLETTAEVSPKMTALHAAAAFGLTAVLGYFLAKGLDVDQPDGFGMSPLQWAVKKGHIEAVRVLLDAGANVNFTVDHPDMSQYKGWTPLLSAAAHGKDEILKLLLDKGAEISARPEEIPSWWDTRWGLRSYEKDVNDEIDIRPYYVDHFLRKSSWKHPRKSRDKGSVDGTEEGVDDNTEDDTAQAPKEPKAGLQGPETTRKRPTALHFATIRGHSAIAKLLIDTGGIDVNARDEDGRTALSHAIQLRNEDIVSAILLLGEEVDVDGADEDGETPLMYAARFFRKSIMEQLFDTGRVKVDKKDYTGRTALSYAASQSRDEEAVHTLLSDKYGAQLESLDNKGHTPLWHAVSTEQVSIIRLLLQKGADPSRRDTLLSIGWEEYTTDNGRIYYSDNVARSTTWHHPNKVKKLGMVDGASAEEEAGTTILMHACRKGWEKSVEALLAAGVDPDATDDVGRSALMFAARRGYSRIVRMLLDTGKVNVDRKDFWGHTAGFYAQLKPDECDDPVETALLLPYVTEVGKGDGTDKGGSDKDDTQDDSQESEPRDGEDETRKMQLMAFQRLMGTSSKTIGMKATIR